MKLDNAEIAKIIIDSKDILEAYKPETSITSTYDKPIEQLICVLDKISSVAFSGKLDLVYSKELEKYVQTDTIVNVGSTTEPIEVPIYAEGQKLVKLTLFHKKVYEVIISYIFNNELKATTLSAKQIAYIVFDEPSKVTPDMILSVQSAIDDMRTVFIEVDDSIWHGNALATTKSKKRLKALEQEKILETTLVDYSSRIKEVRTYTTIENGEKVNKEYTHYTYLDFRIPSLFFNITKRYEQYATRKIEPLKLTRRFNRNEKSVILSKYLEDKLIAKFNKQAIFNFDKVLTDCEINPNNSNRSKDVKIIKNILDTLIDKGLIKSWGIYKKQGRKEISFKIEK